MARVTPVYGFLMPVQAVFTRCCPGDMALSSALCWLDMGTRVARGSYAKYGSDASTDFRQFWVAWAAPDRTVARFIRRRALMAREEGSAPAADLNPSSVGSSPTGARSLSCSARIAFGRDRSHRLHLPQTAHSSLRGGFESVCQTAQSRQPRSYTVTRSSTPHHWTGRRETTSVQSLSSITCISSSPVAPPRPSPM